MNRVSVLGLLAAGAATVALALTSTVSAGTLSRTAARGKATPVVPLFAYSPETCAIYPVHDIKIEQQPQHGAARVAPQAVKLPASFGVCAGTTVTMPWVIYQPTGNYTGADRFTVSWRSYATVLENTSRYQSYDIAVTVK